MKKFYVMVTSLIFGTMYLLSCTKDKGLPVKADTIDTTKLVNVSYKEDIVPILTTYCLGVNGQGCHVSNSNTFAVGYFETYAGLKEKVDNGTIETRVFRDGGGMPPSNTAGEPTLTATDLAVFKKWVAEGAKNN